MKIIRHSSPDEAVLMWLQAELTSERFSNDLQKSLKKYGLSSQVITHPDTSDPLENSLRLKVLKEYRDWFEDDVYAYNWELIELTKDDVKALYYIDYSYWNELSNNTRLVGVAVENVKQGRIVFNVSNAPFFDVAKAADAGMQFAPIILIQKGQNLEIVEGHLRATGYLLANTPGKPLLAVVGYPL